MKKVIAVAIASALAVPQAFAAEGNDGMYYTSAAEGFYASVRARLDTDGDDRNDTGVRNSGSRFGVQGTSEVTGGMEGFYRFELGVPNEGGNTTNSRLNFVGLRGNFGEVTIGRADDVFYTYVSSLSDAAQWNSNSTKFDALGTQNNLVRYSTPDLNGFTGALDLRAANGSMDGSTIDEIGVAGTYSVAGFSFAAAYQRETDALEAIGVPTGGQAANSATATKDDRDTWGVGGTYAQDNWSVGGWYGEQDQRKANGAGTSASDPQVILDDPKETLGLTGSVSVDNISVYAVWEAHAGNGDLFNQDINSSALGVVYHLSGKSRVWVEYAGNDDDTDANSEDYFTVGLRHDF